MTTDSINPAKPVELKVCPECGAALYLGWCADCGFDAVQNELDRTVQPQGDKQ